MLQLFLLTILSVILLLVPLDECRQIYDSSDDAEYQQLKGLFNAQQIESILLPFLKQKASKSSEGPLISSSSYELAKPSANYKLSESSQSPIYRNGQELSWFLKDSHSKKAPVLQTLDSKHLKSSMYSRGQESSWFRKPHSKKPLVLPLSDPNYLPEVPKFKALFPYLVGLLDQSFECSNTVPFSEATLTECKLEKLLEGTQLSPEDSNDQNFPVVPLQPQIYENLDQPQVFRTKPMKIKVRDQLAKNWYGSQKQQQSLAKKDPIKGSTARKFKIFEKAADARKFKKQLKEQLIHKVRKQKKDEKVKTFASYAEPLKKLPVNRISRKSKTQRCFKTRKDDDSDSRTVCVTYPAAWGEGVNYTIPSGTPYPYYYPYYYYPAYYYYPYYFYGRR